MKTEEIKVLKDEASQKMVLLKLASPIAYGYVKPTSEASYVVVSAVNNGYANETFIFPSDEHGNIIDWGELDGSHQNGMNIPRAIADFEARH